MLERPNGDRVPSCIAFSRSAPRWAPEASDRIATLDTSLSKLAARTTVAAPAAVVMAMTSPTWVWTRRMMPSRLVNPRPILLAASHPWRPMAASLLPVWLAAEPNRPRARSWLPRWKCLHDSVRRSAAVCIRLAPRSTTRTPSS